MDCDGLFISVGRTPATELVRGQLELDPGGYILAGETTETSIPGVFAVGDVRTKRLRQVVTAVSDGAVAAIWRKNTWQGGPDVKKKKWLRPVLFTLGGGLAGLACYNFVGCAAGGCAIASKPAASVLYLGLVGWLLSKLFEKERGDGCSM